MSHIRITTLYDYQFGTPVSHTTSSVKTHIYSHIEAQFLCSKRLNPDTLVNVAEVIEDDCCAKCVRNALLLGAIMRLKEDAL